MVDIAEALDSVPSVTIPKDKPVEETHFEIVTDYGAKVVIDVTPKSNPFVKQQQFSVTVDHADGSSQEGNFIVKRLNVGEEARVGVVKASLAKSLQVDADTSLMLHVIAKLSLALLEKPDWFVPTEMYDYDVIIAVYRRVLSFEASFRRDVPQERESTKA